MKKKRNRNTSETYLVRVERVCENDLQYSVHIGRMGRAGISADLNTLNDVGEWIKRCILQIEGGK